MVNLTDAPNQALESEPLATGKRHKLVKLTEINYRRNTESDFTEKIAALDKVFDYASNSEHNWGEEELSLLYGTPLYDQASPAQRLALNHLYWTTQYNQTAATEANAVLYNQVTAGVFSNVGGYDSLCQELALETDQERDHIHAFHTIGYKTKRALLGQTGFTASIQGKSVKHNSGKLPAAKSSNSGFNFGWKRSPLAAFQDPAFRFVTNQVLLREQAQYYSTYLQEFEQKGEPIPAQTTGLLGQLAPRPLLQFFTLNCGTSPFLSCVFYVARFMANMLIKNYEYRYSHYFKTLEHRGEFIPAPVAVSHYHLLDEAFHTTTSQLIAQELYKEFKPSAYEKFVANATIYRAQSIGLSGLSGGLPAIFRNDDAFILSYYRLLQSPVFGMSSEDALYWLDRCLCEEHEGFHVTLKYHQRLLTDLRRLFDGIDYLWAVNREMNVMASGGSIAKAIQANRTAFQQFAKTAA